MKFKYDFLYFLFRKGGIKVKNVVLLAEERTGKIKPNVLEVLV